MYYYFQLVKIKHVIASRPKLLPLDDKLFSSLCLYLNGDSHERLRIGWEDICINTKKRCGTHRIMLNSNFNEFLRAKRINK